MIIFICLHLRPYFVYVSNKGSSESSLLDNVISPKISGAGHVRIQKGDRGSAPLKNHKNIGFLSNTGPDPLKNHKATKPAFNVGPSSARQRSTRQRNGVSLAGQ